MDDGGWMMDDGGWMMEDGGWRAAKLIEDLLRLISHLPAVHF
jgi:hypothetical protein